MSDWVDEEDGRGFGNGCSQYKDNGNVYVDDGENDFTEHENTDDGHRGFGSRRGRGGGRGRVGRGHIGSYGGGRRNLDDNEDNAQSTEFQSAAQNFKRATIQEFLPEVPGRIQRTNNLDELYCIVKYLLEAYKVCLSTEMISNNTSANATRDKMVASNGVVTENIEMSDLIGGKRKAAYSMQLAQNSDLTIVNHSKLSDLPDIFKGATPSPQEQQQAPTATTFKTPFKVQRTVCGVSYQSRAAGIASLNFISNSVAPIMTEREYALRKRLAERRCLKIVPKDSTITDNMRKMLYNFFPLENIGENARLPGVEQEMYQLSALSSEDQSQLEERSAGTSASINVPRQNVASTTSFSGLPPIQLAQSHSDEPSMQLFDERFDTVEEIGHFFPPYIETSGQQERSAILPESATHSTFFTPYSVAIPAGISTRSDGDLVKSAKVVPHTSGLFLAQRAEPSTTRTTGTLPSIREEEFRRTLMRRTLRNSEPSSTPLRPLEGVIAEGRVLPYIQNYPLKGNTEINSADNIRNVAPGVMPMESEDVPEAVKSVEQTIMAQQQTAAEIRIEPLLAKQPVEPDLLNEPRNWLEILRERQVDLQYNTFGTLPKRRKRYHKKRAPNSSISTRRVDHQTDTTDVLQAVTPLPSQLPVAQTSPVDLIQRRYLSNVEETQWTAVQQPTHEQFVHEHIESISTIMDNLVEWQNMLKACNRDSGQNTSTALLPAYYAYNVETLLNADRERLQLKMNILQEIILNVSFNMMKSSLLKNRSLAAVAFNFVIELESAGIIRIRENGHWLGLI